MIECIVTGKTREFAAAFFRFICAWMEGQVEITNEMSESLSSHLHVLLGKISSEKRALFQLRAIRLSKESEAPTILPIARKEGANRFPLSYAQERLWFLDQLDSGSAAYNLLSAVRIKGLLSLAMLEQTISEIIQRYKILRTTFEVGKGQPVQVIHAAYLVKVEVTDLAEIREREPRLKQLILKETECPIDQSSDIGVSGSTALLFTQILWALKLYLIKP